MVTNEKFAEWKALADAHAELMTAGVNRLSEPEWWAAALPMVARLAWATSDLLAEVERLRAWEQKAREALALVMIAMPADTKYACVVRSTEAAAAVLAEKP